MQKFYVKESVKSKKSFSSPETVYEEFKDLKDADQECMWLLCLNVKNKVIDKAMIALGCIDSAQVDLRILLRRLLVSGSASFVLVHNHPSGDTMPSCADLELTQAVKKAAGQFDIKLQDHVIIGNKYFSFAEHSLV